MCHVRRAQHLKHGIGSNMLPWIEDWFSDWEWDFLRVEGGDWWIPLELVCGPQLINEGTKCTISMFVNGRTFKESTMGLQGCVSGQICCRSNIMWKNIFVTKGVQWNLTRLIGTWEQRWGKCLDQSLELRGMGGVVNDMCKIQTCFLSPGLIKKWGYICHLPICRSCSKIY